MQTATASAVIFCPSLSFTDKSPVCGYTINATEHYPEKENLYHAIHSPKYKLSLSLRT